MCNSPLSMFNKSKFLAPMVAKKNVKMCTLNGSKIRRQIIFFKTLKVLSQFHDYLRSES